MFIMSMIRLVCSKGYEGYFCFECQKNYSKFLSSKWVECSKPINIFYFILGNLIKVLIINLIFLLNILIGKKMKKNIKNQVLKVQTFILLRNAINVK